jgi:hypothetical protein
LLPPLLHLRNLGLLGFDNTLGERFDLGALRYWRVGQSPFFFRVGGQTLDSIAGSGDQIILPAQMDSTIVERKQQLLSLLPGVTIPHE